LVCTLPNKIPSTNVLILADVGVAGKKVILEYDMHPNFQKEILMWHEFVLKHALDMWSNLISIWKLVFLGLIPHQFLLQC